MCLTLKWHFLLLASYSVRAKEFEQRVMTFSPPCTLRVENICQRPACLFIGYVSTPKKKLEENNNLYNVRFEWDVELIFMLSMNVLLLLHLLLLYAFFHPVWLGFGVSQLKLQTWIESLFMSLEVGLVLVSTSLQTLPFWSVAIFHKHIWEDHFCVLYRGKDNEFLCQVEEGASPCFRKYNRQHWHGAGDRGQSSLKGQICYREWTYCTKNACCCVRVLHSFTLSWMNWFSD